MAAAMLDDSRKLTLANLAAPLPAEFDPSRCARSGTGKNKPDKHARHGTAMSFCRLYVPNAYLGDFIENALNNRFGSGGDKPQLGNPAAPPIILVTDLQPDVPPDRTGTVATADVSQYADMKPDYLRNSFAKLIKRPDLGLVVVPLTSHFFGNVWDTGLTGVARSRIDPHCAADPRVPCLTDPIARQPFFLIFMGDKKQVASLFSDWWGAHQAELSSGIDHPWNKADQPLTFHIDAPIVPQTTFNVVRGGAGSGDWSETHYRNSAFSAAFNERYPMFFDIKRKQSDDVTIDFVTSTPQTGAPADAGAPSGYFTYATVLKLPPDTTNIAVQSYLSDRYAPSSCDPKNWTRLDNAALAGLAFGKLQSADNAAGVQVVVRQSLINQLIATAIYTVDIPQIQVEQHFAGAILPGWARDWSTKPGGDWMQRARVHDDVSLGVGQLQQLFGNEITTEDSAPRSNPTTMLSFAFQVTD